MGDKVAKWKRWLDLICHDCGNVLLSRDMFLDLHNMIAKNPKMQRSDYFNQYLRDTHIAHVAMMLRKHAKIDKNSISLAGLAEEIRANGGKFASPSVARDFEAKAERFTQSANKVESFADRVIAHRDRRAPSYAPTYDEVNEAIEAMDHLSIQCSLCHWRKVQQHVQAGRAEWLVAHFPGDGH